MSTPSKTSSVVLKTETEHFLYKRLKEEQNERQALQNLVNDLKSQIETLQQQLKSNEGLTEKNPVKPPTAAMETSSAGAEYATDEEELAKESEWIRTKSRKKRKLNTSPTLSPQEADKSQTEKIKKVPPPPPIVVDGVNDYQTFYDFLSENQPAGTFNIKMMSGDCVKINSCNEETYRCITKTLTDNDCLWHSYENKQERPIRVMVKKLPFSCKPQRIIEDLTTKGYKIEDAVNKLSWKSKEPLNMFLLTFNNQEDIRKVYEIKYILGCMVEIQPLRSTKLIPQCKRCQAYGHTHKYCAKEPRCVKCTGKHLTKDCKKSADDKPKCVHCGEAHPANYRGCMIAKEMQKIRNKAVKKPIAGQQVTGSLVSDKTSTIAQASRTLKPISATNKKVSYAQAAAKSSTAVQRNEPVKYSDSNKLDEILKFITSFDERLKKVENSTKTAISKAKQ